jgi:flagellar biosynthetic protein FliP
MTARLAADGHGRPEVSTGYLRAVADAAASFLPTRVIRYAAGAFAVVAAVVATLMLGPGALTAFAAPGDPTTPVAPLPTAPVAPLTPAAPTPTAPDAAGVTLNIGTEPSQSLTVLLLITLLAVAPSLLLLLTSFTKIFVVLSLTRNALGLSTVPPNQVLAGLALFLSMFVMGPVISKVYDNGIAPYLDGTKDRSAAWHDGIEPLRQFMMAHTRPEEIALMLRAGNLPNPANKAAIELTTLIPAFVISELRAALIIGFVIFIPFVIIDLVVASSLMSLGMMMLPPVSVALPFKLLLFVLVDGWGLIITTLVQSYATG